MSSTAEGRRHCEMSGRATVASCAPFRSSLARGVGWYVSGWVGERVGERLDSSVQVFQ